jgi:hypothetical protein
MLEMPTDAFSAMSVCARRRYEECCRPEVVGDVVEEVYGKVRSA